MSSLWTPDGERPVGTDPAPDETQDDTESGIDQIDPETQAQAEALAAEMAEVRQRLAETPADVVVANHLMGLYELAAIHLSQAPPNFTEASLAIDAMTAVTDALPGRLGDNEPVLKDALTQLKMTYVELKNAAVE